MSKSTFRLFIAVLLIALLFGIITSLNTKEEVCVHDWDLQNPEILRVQTCTQGEVCRYICKSCGEYSSEEYKTALAPHSFSTYSQVDEENSCLLHRYKKCYNCGHLENLSNIYSHEFVNGICLFCESENDITDCLHPNAWGFGGDNLDNSCISYSYEWYCPDCNEYGGYQEYCSSEAGDDECKCNPCNCTRKECICEEFD